MKSTPGLALRAYPTGAYPKRALSPKRYLTTASSSRLLLSAPRSFEASTATDSRLATFSFLPASALDPLLPKVSYNHRLMP